VARRNREIAPALRLPECGILSATEIELAQLFRERERRGRVGCLFGKFVIRLVFLVSCDKIALTEMKEDKITEAELHRLSFHNFGRS
jgi:hypothetical protein